MSFPEFLQIVHPYKVIQLTVECSSPPRPPPFPASAGVTYMDAAMLCSTNQLQIPVLWWYLTSFLCQKWNVSYVM